MASACSFADRVEVHHARGFRVEYREGYKVLTTLATDPERYFEGVTSTSVLVRHGCPVPMLTGPLEGAQIVRVPVQRFASGSHDVIALLRLLGRLDVLVATPEPLPYPEVREGLRNGRVRAIGYNAGVNLEQILDLRPQIVAIGAQSPTMQIRITEARAIGIPVLPFHAWIEPTPLAYTEWVKAVAMYLDAERAANQVFDSISSRYNGLAATARRRPLKPPVVSVSPSRNGNWSVDRNSWWARFLEDAGGRNVLADDGPVYPVPLSDERIVTMAAEPVLWFTTATREWDAVLVREPFRRRVKGRLYDTYGVIAELGQPDYWGTVLVRPDIVLTDLVSLIHPDLVPNHSLQFLRLRP